MIVNNQKIPNMAGKRIALVSHFKMPRFYRLAANGLVHGKEVVPEAGMFFAETHLSKTRTDKKRAEKLLGMIGLMLGAEVGGLGQSGVFEIVAYIKKEENDAKDDQNQVSV